MTRDRTVRVAAFLMGMVALTGVLLLVSCSAFQDSIIAPPGYVYAPSILPAMVDNDRALHDVVASGGIPQDWSPEYQEVLLYQSEQLVLTVRAAADQVVAEQGGDE